MKISRKPALLIIISLIVALYFPDVTFGKRRESANKPFWYGLGGLAIAAAIPALGDGGMGFGAKEGAA